MEIKHVAGISLASRRPAEEKGDLAVGRRVLGQVVIDAEGMAAVVPEPFADGAPAVGGEVLERRRIGGRGHHDHGILHRPVVLQRLDEMSDRGILLADGDIDADDPGVLLVENRVQDDG